MYAAGVALPFCIRHRHSSLCSSRHQHVFGYPDTSVTIHSHSRRRKLKVSHHLYVISAVFGKWFPFYKSRPVNCADDEAAKHEFISRILKENPSQVEQKILVGGMLYTGKEKSNSRRNYSNLNHPALVERFSSDGLLKQPDGPEVEGDERLPLKPVYLKDLLRDYRGKLYVPQQVFSMRISEEDEFNKVFEELPRMSFDDFRKHWKSGKVKLLTRKCNSGYDGWFKSYIVDLKKIPGRTPSPTTKWGMKLNPVQDIELHEEYKGPKYEIERQLTSWVGKFPELPHPVAYPIYCRIQSELVALTGLMLVSILIIGVLRAAPVFIVSCATFAVAWKVLWPFSASFFSSFHYHLPEVFEGFRIFIDVFDRLFTFSDLFASLDVLKPILLVLLIMVIGIRFTLSRRSKNFKLWDIWQGIEFSKSKAEARVDGSTGVKFNDIAGIDEAIEELQELVRYLKDPKLFDQMGIKPPHGVLLEGPPGCGKTLIAKAIAGEARVPFYQMAGSEFVEVLVGVGSARIRDLFKRAKVNKPSVIFVDEIDALATRRQGTFGESESEMYNAAVQERETTLNQLLIELDGFDTGKGVIFLAATNRRDLLDPALLRPGRFDRKIRISAPNTKGRFEILKIYSKGVAMSEDVDLAAYAQDLPGWTGAMLAQLVQEAALVAVRKCHGSVVQSDMDDAVERLTVGPKQMTGNVLSISREDECRRAANEVGVALTSHLLRLVENAKVERCDRVSVVPRGKMLSHVVFHRLGDECYKFERRPQLLHRLQVFLGGRAAEEVIFGRDTSTASVDYLAHASWLAHKMLTVYGK